MFGCSASVLGLVDDALQQPKLCFVFWSVLPCRDFNATEAIVVPVGFVCKGTVACVWTVQPPYNTRLISTLCSSAA
jgi:hypothetical protein